MTTESLLHQKTQDILRAAGLDEKKKDKAFVSRLFQHLPLIHRLFGEIYALHPEAENQFLKLIQSLIQGYQNRENALRKRDEEKAKKDFWFLSNQLTGMSLYVDRFAGDLKSMPEKLGYLDNLGVNFLHLMPIFESPAGESDGGYAVSDFRKVDERFGTLGDLISLRKKMHDQGMFLMLDIVLNHTSHHHEWAKKAKAGDKYYQDFFYTYDNRWIPNEFNATMPDIFPESAPGNFTWNEEMGKWVMTVFHSYQWDLNYTNPIVFREMLENILFYGNLGVDVLRIDAPAFIWKKTGTASQNLPEAHTLLRLIKQCVQVATPGMALLGEAIVAPKEIMNYFGTGEFIAQECDFAYNATQMALQWDMLATGETKIMLNAQHEILQKPYGTSWITYTRCHDDIGLGYDDYMIAQAGKDPYQHRKFLKEYYSYSGEQWMSPARGALFSSNPKTGDARISGTLASLCGLEKAVIERNENSIDQSIQKILLMQAHFIFLGGLPMLFYGDEIGYTNDYSFQNDPGKSYDNRWMHRPVIDWEKVRKVEIEGSIENRVFFGTKKLLEIRKQKPLFSDSSNISWLSPHNIHVAGFIRRLGNERVYCLFNFCDKVANLTWYAFREQGEGAEKLKDLWSGAEFGIGPDHEHLNLEPYGFMILEPK
ncbi:alpha-amylase family glycosyl hydrolase [Algoriphagus boritolerans]|uniref:Amylosucrase n=1 Tax=Algoriphagus boritolerans DSM 17298 = JCM 18970 TaxID=1120964 RepID=A0A1H5XT80_9BACT|nr:alpha-amylase family glycosyl hydrolase [Algoriphagus boritolerans]SEG14735.1 amylosucrase [Algoriphagus boritolerans DSM 17298 = JCM 18970]